MGPIRESHGLMWAKDIRTAKDVNGLSYMGTMCDVHGLTWAIRAPGNEVFTWAILYGNHVRCAWSCMGHMGSRERGF